MVIALIALSGGAFSYFIFTLLFASDSRAVMRRRLGRYYSKADIDEIQVEVLRQQRGKKHGQGRFRGLQLVSRELSGYLTASGVKLRPAEFILVWALSAVIPALVGFLASGNALTSLGMGVIGLAVPPLLVQRSGKKRQSLFNKQLGESLTIMGNSIRAGFTFLQAMENIAAEMQPPLAMEFAKTLREVRYGVSMEDALRHMVDRAENRDLDLLVSAVLISEQVGGNLSDIMGVISETIQDRLKIKSEVRVLTTSGRFSGIIIGLLPLFIILILMVINPNYFKSFAESGIGRLMLAGSAVLETLGFILIRKIVDIRY